MNELKVLLEKIDIVALESLVVLLKKIQDETPEIGLPAPKKARKAKAAPVEVTTEVEAVVTTEVEAVVTTEVEAVVTTEVEAVDVPQEVVDQAFALALSPPLTPIPPTFQQVTDFWPRIKNMPTPPEELRELCKKVMTATLALDKEEGAEMVKGSLVVVGAKRLSEVPDWLLTSFISALVFGNIDLRHSIARGELND